MNSKKKILIVFTSFCIILSLTITYAIFRLIPRGSLEIMSIDSSTSSRMKASFMYFSGRKQKEINLKQGEELIINFNSEITEGKLTMQLLDSTGNVIKQFENTVNNTEKIKASQAEKYKVLVNGEKAKGNYEITWHN